MRKRSPATEIRWLKREVKAQDAQIGALLRELDERRRIGAMMSNLCLNIKQQDRIPQDVRESASVTRAAWDGIKREAGYPQ